MATLSDPSLIPSLDRSWYTDPAVLEAAGIAEVILYVSVGLKPHAQVKHEMARFMAEVAPAFA